MALPSADISIFFVCLVISLILTLFGYGMKKWIFYFLSACYGLAVLAYLFDGQFGSFTIGTFVIDFYVFAIAWIFLAILVPLILIIVKE